MDGTDDVDQQNGAHDEREELPVLNPSLHGKSILADTDLTPEEIGDVLDTAEMLKDLRRRGVPHTWLAGKTLGLIFQAPSTRTRLAFQAGMQQLGGRAIFLGMRELQLNRGETLEDTAHITSGYLDAMAVRVADRQVLLDLAKGATVPVFNALTSYDHPIEALSDLLTLREQFGRLQGLRFAYLGDGNNICHSLLLASAATGVHFTIAAPGAWQPDPAVVATAHELAVMSGAHITLTTDAMSAAENADAVYTDVHESMGQTENPAKLMALAPYRVTKEVMARAKPTAVFMHCLPMHRGQEVDAEVADGPQSIIFEQAENRLHVHKAVLLQVLSDQREPVAMAPAANVA